MLNSIPNILTKNIILELISICSLTPLLKLKAELQSSAKLTEIKETLDSSNIWRVRDPKLNCFTFHQNRVSGHVQTTLDYVLISNFLQEIAIRVDDNSLLSNDVFDYL